jgi:hypothetical protein
VSTERPYGRTKNGLMPNHVHLIVVPRSEDGLRRGIGAAHRRDTRHVNFREGDQTTTYFNTIDNTNGHQRAEKATGGKTGSDPLMSFRWGLTPLSGPRPADRQALHSLPLGLEGDRSASAARAWFTASATAESSGYRSVRAVSFFSASSALARRQALTIFCKAEKGR